jgi:hypothetical protein
VRSEGLESHGVTHCHLKAARLPIPPRAIWEIARRLGVTREAAKSRLRRARIGVAALAATLLGGAPSIPHVSTGRDRPVGIPIWMHDA